MNVCLRCADPLPDEAMLVILAQVAACRTTGWGGGVESLKDALRNRAEGLVLMRAGFEQRVSFLVMSPFQSS